MKITANLLLAASFFCLVACSKSETNSETAKLEDLSSSADPNLAPLTPGSSTMPAPAGNNTAGAKINPPHGEPGHDCAVPVGQPLTGAPASTPQPGLPPNTDISVTTNEEPKRVEAVAVGMNPPHGEPGHDCAIPVGAPLKK